MRDYWEKFYLEHPSMGPSPFAEWCAGKMEKGTIVDVGSGNGRDSAFFRAKGHVVQEVDFAFGKSQDIVDFIKENTEQFDYIYARFFLHAIDIQTEQIFLDALPHITRKKIFIEARAIGDVGFQNDHFRRLIHGNTLLSELIRRNIQIQYFTMRHGLAVFEKQDPYIIRCIGMPETHENMV